MAQCDLLTPSVAFVFLPSVALSCPGWLWCYCPVWLTLIAQVWYFSFHLMPSVAPFIFAQCGHLRPVQPGARGGLP